MIKRSFWISALTAALAACSSGVKLNDVPVEDKTASANNTNSQPVLATSTVAPVVSSNAGTQSVAPAGLNVVFFYTFKCLMFIVMLRSSNEATKYLNQATS